MLHTLRFSLQNVVYFIMLPFWFLYYSHFTYRVCQNLNVKLRCQKANGLCTNLSIYINTFKKVSHHLTQYAGKLIKISLVFYYINPNKKHMSQCLFLSDNCSTCFGFHYHPSSGAQNNCNYNIW